MAKYVVSTILLVIVAILYLGYRMGLHQNVNVELQTEGPFYLLHAPHIGPYHMIVPTIETVEKYVKAHGGDCRFSFGEYLDDPKTVAEDRLRSRGGCFVDSSWKDKTGGYQLDERPPRRYLVLKFSGSPGVAPLVVYPRAEREMRLQKLKPEGAVIERYEILGDKSGETTYFFPVAPM